MSVYNCCESIYNYGQDLLELSYAPYVTMPNPDPKAEPVYIDKDKECPVSLFPLSNIIVRLKCDEENPHYFDYDQFINIQDRTCCSSCKIMTRPEMASLLVQEQHAKQKQYRPVKEITTELKSELRARLQSPLARKSMAVCNGMLWTAYGVKEIGKLLVECLDLAFAVVLKVCAVFTFSSLTMCCLVLKEPESRASTIRNYNSDLNEYCKQIARFITNFLFVVSVFSALVMIPSTTFVITNCILICIGAHTIVETLGAKITKPNTTPRQIWKGDLAPRTTREIHLCKYKKEENRTECESFEALREEGLKLTAAQRKALATVIPKQIPGSAEINDLNNRERTRLGIDPQGNLNANDLVTKQRKAFMEGIEWDLPQLTLK